MDTEVTRLIYSEFITTFNQETLTTNASSNIIMSHQQVNTNTEETVATSNQASDDFDNLGWCIFFNVN